MTLLIVLTVVEIVLLVAVLAVYLVLLHRRLRSINSNLGLITFGVRAVETQTSSIGPSVARLNERLADSVGTLTSLAEKGEGPVRPFSSED